MQTYMILLGTTVVGAACLGIRAYNRAVARELAPRQPNGSESQIAPDMPSFTDLSPHDALEFLGEHPGAVLLDVRTPGECAGGIIEGALMIPMQELQGREDEIPAGPLLVYCAVGARSAAVAEYLARRGREEVFNLEGGFMEWPGKRFRP